MSKANLTGDTAADFAVMGNPNRSKKPEPAQKTKSFDPSGWSCVPRCELWFWTTLKENEVRFIVVKKPHECSDCTEGPVWIQKRKKIEIELAAGDLSTKREAQLKSKQRGLIRNFKCARYERHLNMLEVQRVYAQSLDERILQDTRFAVVYEDFGAYYDVCGDKVIDLVLAVRHQDEYGGIAWSIIHNFCRNEDFLSEDCYTVRDVWLHHLRKSGELDKWDSIVVVRDGGAHFQNNRVSYLESCLSEMMKDNRVFTYEVSALAKRHGYNIADSAISRVASVSRRLAISGTPPILAEQWADVVNDNDRFENTKAYFFDDIDRNPDNFPDKLKDFKGIQQYCQFLYSYKNQYGNVIRDPGYVRARVVSTRGKFTFHDFLQRYRPSEWGSMCSDCSQKHQRPIYHNKQGEIVRAENCVRKGRRRGVVNRRPTSGLVQPDPTRIDVSKQPGTKRKSVDMGPDAVTCEFCSKTCKNTRGLTQHTKSAHPGEAAESQARKKQQQEEASKQKTGQNQNGKKKRRRARPMVSEPESESDYSQARKELEDSEDEASEPQARPNRSVVSESESDVSDSDSYLGLNSEGDEYFEVGDILNRRKCRGRVQYQVQWKPIEKYPDPTWEDESSLNCPDLLEAFNNKSTS